MKETLTLKKVQLSIVAVAMAAIVALGMGAFAQVAYAEDAVPLGTTKTVTDKKTGVKYVVKNGTTDKGVALVQVKAPKSVKSVSVPATVKIDNLNIKITHVNKNAFKGTNITKVTLSKNISKIKANAFAKSKVKTLVLSKPKYAKAYVKNSLKGSKITKIQAKSKASVKNYKKVFTKKNAGKKVTIK